jgi:hypothetical protein
MVAISCFRSAASLARGVLFFGLCLSALGLAGCASHTRYADIGCVTAHADVKDGVAAYNEIKITGPTDPNAPRINLKIPNGQIIDRKSLTYLALKKAGFEEVPSDAQQPGASYDYRLSRYGAFFVFFNGRLVEMYLSKTPNTSIEIGRERSKKFYALPLTQAQLEELFGHPEKIY